MDVESISLSGTWWRHVPAGADVLYEPRDPADSRWQRGTVVDAWYFADSPETVWAEWYRAVSELGVPPSHLLPRDLWRWEVSLVRVADLSTAERLDRAGLRPPTPGRTTWPSFQRVGEELHADGFQSVLAPSAARPGNLVLCVFRDARDVPGVPPIPPPTTVDEPPIVPRGMTT